MTGQEFFRAVSNGKDEAHPAIRSSLPEELRRLID
jgi:hypothetical protein